MNIELKYRVSSQYYLILHIYNTEVHFYVLFCFCFFECRCTFSSCHGGKRPELSLFVRLLLLACTRGRGTGKASATWRGWVLQKICNVCIWMRRISLCMYESTLCFIKKTTEPEQGSFSGWQMEMITHCGAKLVLAPLQKCHHVCIIHLPTSQLFLCPFVSSLLYTVYTFTS